MFKKTQAHVLVYLLVALVALGLGFAGYKAFMAPKPLQLINTFPKLNPLAPFNAQNHRAESVTEKDFIGHWSIVFFGFTTCPDICPTTMMDMNQVQKGLDQKFQQDTQFVFISVDPERDTVEKLASYVPAFNPEFIGLTMDLKQTRAVTKNLGVAFMKTPSHDGNPDNYLVDHTARWFIVDPLGRRFALINPADALGKDLVQLVIDDYQNLRQQARLN
ncbi:SCO family protein [Kangiella sp. TOML190]|uniref:SCO family protein n=1 Tax=Kangiella sp. TOML190 TaxID=2931351 RepID=UPI002042067B|nr:SCO family protein [Kangiella sp. TOML190]